MPVVRLGVVMLVAYLVMSHIQRIREKQEVMELIQQLAQLSAADGSAEHDKYLHMLMMQGDSDGMDGAGYRWLNAATAVNPLDETIAQVYGSNYRPSVYSNADFVNRNTLVQPYTTNKLREMRQVNDRFRATHPDWYASKTYIRGWDPAGHDYRLS